MARAGRLLPALVVALALAGLAASAAASSRPGGDTSVSFAEEANEDDGGIGLAPTAAAEEGRPASSRALLGSGVAEAPLPLFFDRAYLTVALTPRKEGAPGACPKGGARGAEGQRVAALLLRSLRSWHPDFEATRLAPRECWVKPGARDQLLDSKAPPHAYWVLEARDLPWSAPTADPALSLLTRGDHTSSLDLGNGKISLPRNGSCLVRRARRVVDADAPPLLPVPGALRRWCGSQGRAGRQALSLHLAFLTRAPPLPLDEEEAAAERDENTTCGDGLANGAESGVDCGVPCVDAETKKSKPCALGEGCASDADCPSGVKCDLTQRAPLSAAAALDTPGDGTVRLSLALGTCAERCANYTCPAVGTGAVANPLAPDVRYASLFCDVGVVSSANKDANTGLLLPVGRCSGVTYNATTTTTATGGGSVTTGATFRCCSDTLPCSRFPSCDAATTYADPSPSSRCSNARCDGAGDAAKCCLPRASCGGAGSGFSAAVCAKGATDASTSVFFPAGLCIAGACSATLAADRLACCPQRALCSTLFATAAACTANDPVGPDPTLLYALVPAANATAAGAPRCSSKACDAASDWPSCCSPPRATCATGFFGAKPTPLECPPASTPIATTAGALCGNSTAGARVCSVVVDGAGNCCAPVAQRTCQAFSTSKPTACATLGDFVANPGATSCFTDNNCRVLCCAMAGPLLTCDRVRFADASFCGGGGGGNATSSSSFLATPRYAQCSAAVQDSCREACCQ